MQFPWFLQPGKKSRLHRGIYELSQQAPSAALIKDNQDSCPYQQLGVFAPHI
jgi:hypothetical protein